MTPDKYHQRTCERQTLIPIPGFDRHIALAGQMPRADFLLMRLVMDAEAYHLMIFGNADFVARSLVESREYLEAKEIVPESAYYGGAFYSDSQPANSPDRDGSVNR